MNVYGCRIRSKGKGTNYISFWKYTKLSLVFIGMATLRHGNTKDSRITSVFGNTALCTAYEPQSAILFFQVCELWNITAASSDADLKNNARRSRTRARSRTWPQTSKRTIHHHHHLLRASGVIILIERKAISWKLKSEIWSLCSFLLQLHLGVKIHAWSTSSLFAAGNL